MNQAAKGASLVALLLVLAPCLLFFFGTLSLSPVKTVTLLGSVLWFIATPAWVGRKLPVDADQVEI